MDSVDSEIVTLIQASFPVEERPYEAIGKKIGISEDEVIRRLEGIKDSGEIRRMGASFDSRKLGYSSTLCAVHVPDDKMQAAIDAINSYHNITHNYERNHDYNVWFTVIAPSPGRVDEILHEIEERAGIGPIINLPATRLFKIQVDLPVLEG